MLRPQLATDDSFVFNRVVGRIKESVAALPEASGEDDAMLQVLQMKAALICLQPGFARCALDCITSLPKYNLSFD